MAAIVTLTMNPALGIATATDRVVPRSKLPGSPMSNGAIRKCR
jgi:hypothetical protein